MAQRHLIYQTAFIGDVLLSTPLIREFRKLYPGDTIVLACRKGVGQLFKDLKLVDEVIEIDKKSGLSRREFHQAILKESYGVVLCPHESFRTALLMRRIRAIKKVGFETWWNGFAFDARLVRPMLWPEALRQLSLLRALNVSVADQFERSIGASFMNTTLPRGTVREWPDRIPKFAQLFVPANPSFVQATQEKFGVRAGSVFVAPGSVWPTKMWKEKNFVEIVQRLSSRGWKVYLTGAKVEVDLCLRIAKEAGGDVMSLAGKTTLTELHALLSVAKFIVSNDSSPIHLAAMAGAPSVAIFGPTTLKLGYRPWDDRSKVAQVDLPCRPCGKHGHVVCPLGTHACMENVTAAQVESLIKDLE